MDFKYFLMKNEIQKGQLDLFSSNSFSNSQEPKKAMECDTDSHATKQSKGAKVISIDQINLDKIYDAILNRTMK